MTYVNDDVTYVEDDVTYVDDDVTYVDDEPAADVMAAALSQVAMYGTV